MPKTTQDSPAPIRHEVEVDTRIAAAHAAYLVTTRNQNSALQSLYYLIPNKLRADRYKADGRVVIDGEYSSPSPTQLEELFIAGTIGSSLDSYARKREAESFENFRAKVAAVKVAYDAYVEVSKEYDGWTRFFLVPGGHIHSSMDCSTCNKMGKPTEFAWLPDLSGLTEADAVAVHGPWLCTVCYPSAPVEYTNGEELAAAAKAAERCPGSGTYATSGGRRYAKCPICETSVRLSSNSRIFAHDTPK
jgi:hypothetical protein